MNKQSPVNSVMERDENPSSPAPLTKGEEMLIIITCARCLSKDTEMVDHEHQIYRCRNCGEWFERPSG